ncbi:hypothetical protein [Chamaesiphon sp. VAR_48_metabat_403]|uniref:tetratricopeptide repeat protein n=1 Tax=Chamaesiphon sp. VAR_48_metabat_403 TaxID=2964700 RepID=UPI00286E0FD2|nr:hypothetical protein [Chamaesiphon sp. VAR_48_metabat_403]
MEKSKLTKIIVLASGGAFLASSVMGLSGLIGSSIDRPTATENATQSQNAQVQAAEKGFLTVLKREPKNQTALRGIGEIVTFRMQQGDVQGTKALLEELVRIDPTKKEYKEFLDAVNKQIADTKKVGTLKPTEPTQPTQPSKSK